MTAKLLTGEGVSSYGFSKRNVEVDDDYTCDLKDDTIFSTKDGATILLCDDPWAGKQILVVSINSGCVVDGGQFPIISGPLTLGINGRVQLTFGTAGAWVITDDDVQSANLAQNEWHINANTGNDINTGKTTAQALKTWAEMQRRWGTWTTLKPTGGTLSIFIDSNTLPVSDPMTCRNFLSAANGDGGAVTVIVNGKKKVLSSGTIQMGVGGVTTRDRDANIPWGFKANGVTNSYWSQWIGKVITNTTVGARFGSRTYAMRDEGNKKVSVKQWVFQANPDLVGIQGDYAGLPPAPGDSFQVLDYSNVAMGEFVTGNASVFATVIFQNLHLVTDTFTKCSTLDDVSYYFLDNISESHFAAPANAGFWVISNCCPRRGGEFNNVAVNDLSNGWLASVDSENTRVSTGTEWFTQGDSMFMGDNASFLVKGKVSGSLLSFFDTLESFLMIGGSVSLDGFDFLLNENSFDTPDWNPLWGSNPNGGLIFLAQGTIDISQDTHLGVKLPSMTVTPTNGLPLVAIINSNRRIKLSENKDFQAFGFDYSGTLVNPPFVSYTKLVNMTWANLDVLMSAAPGSGFRQVPDFTPSLIGEMHLGVASDPTTPGSITWENLNFTV